MNHLKTKAARPGSVGGEGIGQRPYNNMMAPAVQPHCTPMPGQGATTGQRAEQLRLFALDGALSEPYVPARAGKDAAMFAAAVVGTTQ